jgi:hypothetical protein
MNMQQEIATLAKDIADTYQTRSFGKYLCKICPKVVFRLILQMSDIGVRTYYHYAEKAKKLDTVIVDECQNAIPFLSNYHFKETRLFYNHSSSDRTANPSQTVVDTLSKYFYFDQRVRNALIQVAEGVDHKLRDAEKYNHFHCLK